MMSFFTTVWTIHITKTVNKRHQEKQEKEDTSKRWHIEIGVQHSIVQYKAWTENGQRTYLSLDRSGFGSFTHKACPD
jgi:hypothetical protein